MELEVFKDVGGGTLEGSRAQAQLSGGAGAEVGLELGNVRSDGNLVPAAAPALSIQELREECRSLHIDYSISDTARELETRMEGALRKECRSLRIEHSISDTVKELKVKLKTARDNTPTHAGGQ